MSKRGQPGVRGDLVLVRNPGSPNNQPKEREMRRHMLTMVIGTALSLLVLAPDLATARVVGGYRGVGVGYRGGLGYRGGIGYRGGLAYRGIGWRGGVAGVGWRRGWGWGAAGLGLGVAAASSYYGSYYPYAGNSYYGDSYYGGSSYYPSSSYSSYYPSYSYGSYYPNYGGYYGGYYRRGFFGGCGVGGWRC